MKTTDNATKILPQPPVCEVTLVIDQIHLLITATKKKVMGIQLGLRCVYILKLVDSSDCTKKTVIQPLKCPILCVLWMSLCGAFSSPICLCSHPVLTNNRDSPDCLMKSTCTGVAALPQNVYLLSWQTAVAMFFCAKWMIPALPPQLGMKALLKSPLVKYRGTGSWISACCALWLGQWNTTPLHLHSDMWFRLRLCAEEVM